MSSRDIGPALPPHMRSFDEERSDEQDERRRKYRDKYSQREEERERERERRTDRDRGRDRDVDRDRDRDVDRDRDRDVNRDRDRDRDRDVNRDRDRDRDRDVNRDRDRDRNRNRSRRDEFSGRPSTHSNDRDRQMPRRQEDERVLSKREKTERSVTEATSSKRSKRSKTDRTYNTDTEESSDDESYTKLEWTRGKESKLSDSEEEDMGTKDETGSEESDTIGPALPPSFSKSNCELSSRTKENVAMHSNESRFCQSSFERKSNLSCSDEEPEADCEDTIDFVGPALPPHLLKSDCSKGKDTIGPALPPGLGKSFQIEEENVSIGPALPPHLIKDSISEEEISDSVGPALPPHLLSRESSSSSIIGPAIPAHLKMAKESDEDSAEIGPILPSNSNRSVVVGPSLPPGMDIEKYSREASEASSDDEVVGPLLPGEMMRNEKNYVVQAQLERNAAAIKRKMEEKDMPGSTATRREDWMLELPPEGTVDLGLGPRTFRARGAPEKGADRSMWTDTPADKARKEEEAKRRFELGITSTEEVKKEALSKNMSNKDKSMEAVVKKHKRSKESLLDSHQKKLEKEKKKKEKAGVKQERRPFNRETDLKTNVFDDAQKKAIYKKAQFLDNRFSSGESKFL